jgi:hypothetical protein
MNEPQRAAVSAQDLSKTTGKGRAPAIAAGLIVASLLTAAASFLWAPTTTPLVSPNATIGRAAQAVGGSALRSLSYYPEQLAALNSLSHFTPLANGKGAAAPKTIAAPNSVALPMPAPRPASFAAALAAPAPEGKPHRVNAAARIGAVSGLTAAAVATPTIETAAQAPAPQESGAQVFGVKLPAMPALPSMSLPAVSVPAMALPSMPALPVVEAASAQLAGLGAQVSKLWR